MCQGKKTYIALKLTNSYYVFECVLCDDQRIRWVYPTGERDPSSYSHRRLKEFKSSESWEISEEQVSLWILGAGNDILKNVETTPLRDDKD